ncbi:AraC family transcriptional regulator [Mesorhizobium sp. LHD-90]|uniref:helix-turn-helix transcriptional regulator n=1 Tax=Mesorhizobium sp. LHD-90 TaxID=3071414 RepID=UPI0027E17DE6|nr:AraC family transcriptional regulator [Mesorhizobium sp. LHD-90]MDQ6433540.1 AraC family transcriptional regulator [Mesorhizobium sp. LHD-90]
MDKLVLSTQGMPDRLDDRGRFNTWHDMYVAAYCEFDLRRVEDKPFAANTEFQAIGGIGVASTDAAVDRVLRNKQHVAGASLRSNFCLAFSRNAFPIVQVQLGRETVHRIDSPVLVTEGEAGDIRQLGGFNFLLLDIPPQLLIGRVANAYDMVARQLDAAPQVAAHLKRYIGILPQLTQGEPDRLLLDHIAATLIDLVALVLGANGDSADLAKMRGLRAARLEDVFALIRKHFADPAFSTAHVARKLGLTPRYVNDLLQETGIGFAERVTELRLQTARKMLADKGKDRLKVIDIAYAVGFNEVSYFNRRFRQRFGEKPSDARGHADGDGLVSERA